MLEDIKKIQGINHNEFDAVITMWIDAAKIDLQSIGIVGTQEENVNSLINNAIITYVLSFLDVANAELYANSYLIQKDVLRHTSEFTNAI